jgi:D-alanine-D-alanine ligase-like ATP-grasp enzyme
VARGATHLWANTIVFAQHPLQVSKSLTGLENEIWVVGQPPNLVELYDDKNVVNHYLRRQPGLTLPKAITVNPSNIDNLEDLLRSSRLLYPVVAKPIRGRGSHGVKVCSTLMDLSDHVQNLFIEAPEIMLEEFLSGEEITVTVLPPSPSQKGSYRSLPIVMRYNHINGIAPYNGVVAVTKNSRVLSVEEMTADSTYERAAKECEVVAELLRVTAPIRLDLRRFSNTSNSPFALFDVNMKPVCLIHLPQDFFCNCELMIIEHDRTWPSWARRSSQFIGNRCKGSWVGLCYSDRANSGGRSGFGRLEEGDGARGFQMWKQ